MCFHIKKILSLPPQNDETFIENYADIAQLVEQLICNQPVVGSSPTIGSRHKRNNDGRVPERSNGTDCKSAG